MRSCRLAVLSLVLTAASVGTAVPASAVPPTRDCPSPFDARTRAEQLVLAAQILSGRTAAQIEEAVDATLAAYDKNGDGTLCLDVHPLRPGQERPFVNFIDNVVPSAADRR